MKLKNRLKFGAMAMALAAPVIALPLINAVKTTNTTKTTVKLTDIPSKRVPISGKSYYEVVFETDSEHPEWGTYASFAQMNIIENDVVLQIPDVVEQNGVKYKMRTLNCRGCRNGHGTIKLIDFSKAEWVDKICLDCFAHTGEVGGCVKIKSVNFKGAKRLKKIDQGAFAHQYFDVSYFENKTLDLGYCPELESLGKWAFDACCADNKNVFDKLIFGPSIKSIGKRAFESDNKKTCPYFRKIIFTDRTPPKNLFESHFPRLYNKDPYSIIVPFDAKTAYLALDHFDHAYSQCFYESTINFYEHSGGTTLAALSTDSPGFDPNPWIACDIQGKKRYDTKLWLTNTFDDNIQLYADGRLHWKNKLPNGSYDTFVYGYKYDDDEHKKLSVITSPKITLTVYDGTLTGQTFIRASSTAPGESSEWSVELNDGTTKTKPYSIEYRIKYLPEALQNKVKTDLHTGKISWESGITAGKYSFVLEAKIWPKQNSGNQIYLYQTIYFNVDSYSQPKITYARTSEGSKVNLYTGQHLVIKQDEGVTFKISQPDSTTWEKFEDLKLSIEQITPVWDTEKKNWQFRFNYADHPMKPGRYQFCAHGKVQETSQSQTVELYTINFDITVLGSSPLDLETLPSDIYVNKVNHGSTSVKVINSPNAIITDVHGANAPWMEDTETRIAQKKIKFNIDPNDRQSIIIEWNNDFSPEETKPIDVVDGMIDIYIENPESNEVSMYHKGLTIIATNEATVDYGGGQDKIVAYPNTKNISPLPFNFKLNGVESSGTWEVATDDSQLKEVISIVPDNSGAAHLICDLSTKTITLGSYNVFVYCYNASKIVIGYTNIVLNVTLDAQMVNVPDQLEITANTSGKTKSKISTNVGGKPATKVTYTITGLDENMWVDDDGYIAWNDKIDAGSYEILLKASATTSSGAVNCYKYIPVFVGAKPKNNTAAIIGGSVGGAVAVAGGTTGAVLGTRKHRLLKGKKK